MSKYQPQQFENKWIDRWNKEKTYKTPTNKPLAISHKPKQYVLDMFPYPSGAGLHVGHPRGYTATDIMARFHRMNGDQVLHPMGWDAFGLPAENAAIKAKKNPKDMVPANIANFKRQMQMLGFSYDWDREFATTDPSYYRFTQWLFIQFFKLGLLEKKLTPVYYCPFCKTGLAEEEVLPNGTHERCGNQITRKNLPQWMFRITTYADSLLEGLDGLKWPTGILEMQKNWIGKDKGLNIMFRVVGENLSSSELGSNKNTPQTSTLAQNFTNSSQENITVWTKYWETVFGVTFIVVAPEYTWLQELIKQDKVSAEVKTYVRESLAKTDEQRLKDEKDKTGVFTGYYAINPVNGKKVPVWVADYVLSNVGTGAVMGVPSHDERDFQFVKKYGLPLLQVVSYEDENLNRKIAAGEIYKEGEGKLVNSGAFDGMDAWGEGKQKMAEWMIRKNVASWKINYHLRDWIFSRQRYWGEPIPMAYCDSCAKNKKSWFTTNDGLATTKQYQKISKLNEVVKESAFGWFPIDEKNLPLELPYLDSYEPSETGQSPLVHAEDWLQTTCPHCGGKAVRETDTMPNWAGSCWYFLYFPREADVEKEKDVAKAMQLVFMQANPWHPVDWYVGGAEHAVLHLLYARFWMHILNDMGLISFREPFMRLRNVGMILAEDHRKMSKSWGNVINPDDVVSEYGADTLRMYEMFMAPFSQEIAWSTSSLQGCYRFLKRVWDIYQNKSISQAQMSEKKVVSSLQKTIQKVTQDIQEFKFNTAVAAMMEFINEYEKSTLTREDAKKFLKLLAPFAPFMTEEIWQEVLGEKTSIHLAMWPKVDENKIQEEELVIPVQINGKVRGTINIGREKSNEKTIVNLIKNDERFKKYIEGMEYKIIYIEGKIISFSF